MGRRGASLEVCPGSSLGLCMCGFGGGSRGEDTCEVQALGLECCRRGVPPFSPVPSSLHSQVGHSRPRPAVGKMVSKPRGEDGGFPGSGGMDHREETNLEAQLKPGFDR